MILITGASGKTGLAILKALRNTGITVRGLVHRQEQVAATLEAGATQAWVADLENEADLSRALQGIEVVYVIIPNMDPHEVEHCQLVLDQAKRAGVSRLVYHSVLHPQTQAMPHHWNKLRVEERVFSCGIPATILQPCAYMQNLLAYWDTITRQGIYSVPYAGPLSLVDLADVADAAARVLREPAHTGAIYELAGPQALTQSQVAEIFSQVLKRPVQFSKQDPVQWEKDARGRGMGNYAIDTLLNMFAYYDQHGLVGNGNVLNWLCGRSTNLEQFLQREVKRGQTYG